MQKIIYTSKFYCELCKQERPIHLYGSTDSSFTPDYEDELIDWARHFHWTDNHRVCAICGKLVHSGELELIVNDGKVHVHNEYTDEYKKIEQGDQFGHLLIVHEDCLRREK